MKTFEYTIKDELGIHARPAGMLAKTAKGFESQIIIEKDGKEVLCTKLIALMGLGIKCGDTVKFKIEGSDEETAEKTIKEFMEANL